MLQNLLLNNALTQQHTKALTLYSQAILQVIAKEEETLTQADYKHLFLDLVFKL